MVCAGESIIEFEWKSLSKKDFNKQNMCELSEDAEVSMDFTYF